VKRFADYLVERTAQRTAELMVDGATAQTVQHVDATIAAARAAAQEEASWQYRQLEATISLAAVLPLRAPLPPMRGYPISPDFALAVVDAIDETGAALVVELGSGVSTLIAAYALEARGRGRVRSLEHLPDYAAQTRALLARHGFADDAAEVRDAPLCDVTLADDVFPWYDQRALDGLSDIDVLVVDGPPGPSHLLARYPALPLLHERVRSGGIVLLDDGDRPEEQEIVKRWREALPSWSVDELDVEKGAFRLRKC
jgi:predicted O-methyltransferase YrrM